MTINKSKITLFCFSLSLCAIVACAPKRNAEQTATRFLKAINDKSYAQARALSTPKTQQMIKMMQTLSQLQSIFGDKDTSKKLNLKEVKCTEKKNTADCTYCCNAAGESQKVHLVLEKGKWLVDAGKDNPVGDMDFGGSLSLPNTQNNADETEQNDKSKNPYAADSSATNPNEVALAFANALSEQNYVEVQNLSTAEIYARVAQSAIAQRVLTDAPKSLDLQYKQADCTEIDANRQTNCTCKTTNATKLNMTLTKGFDGEWSVTALKEPTALLKPDQAKPESVAAFFITYLLNGSWDDAEAISTPETARTITFLTRTAMNRPESFDNLAKLQCLVSADRASCTYCCNPLNDEDTLILIKKDDKWWVDWRLK